MRPLDIDQQRCNGAGYGVASVTCPAGSRWRLRAITVSVIGWAFGDAQPICRLYHGSPSPAALVDATYSGQQDTSDVAVELLGGETLTAEWTGAAANAAVLLRVAGDAA